MSSPIRGAGRVAVPAPPESFSELRDDFFPTAVFYPRGINLISLLFIFWKIFRRELDPAVDALESPLFFQNLWKTIVVAVVGVRAVFLLVPQDKPDLPFFELHFDSSSLTRRTLQYTLPPLECKGKIQKLVIPPDAISRVLPHRRGGQIAKLFGSGLACGLGAGGALVEPYTGSGAGCSPRPAGKFFRVAG